MPRSVLPTDAGLRCVKTCMRVEFHQTKNGLPSLFAHFAEARVHRGVVLIRSKAVIHATRAEHCLELRIFWVLGDFGLLLRIQVIKVAKKFVETVNRREKVIAITEMILAELPGSVTKRLEQVGERWVFLL